MKYHSVLQRLVSITSVLLLLGCEDRPAKKAKQPPEPKEILSYENRFTVHWNNEIRDGVGVTKCKIYASTQPKILRNFGSGTGGRDKFNCEGDDVALVEFSDGTQFGCFFQLNPRLVPGIMALAQRGTKVPGKTTFDDIDANGKARRTWLDYSVGIVSKIKIDPIVKESTLIVGNHRLTLQCFSSSNGNDNIVHQKYKIKDSDFPINHNNFTITNIYTYINADASMTNIPEKFSWDTLKSVRYDRIRKWELENSQ